MTNATEIERVASYLHGVDSWDTSLWEAFHRWGDDTFCGDAKELNHSFMYGANLLSKSPEKFEIWNIGFISGCGYGIDTLASRVIETWDEENEE